MSSMKQRFAAVHAALKKHGPMTSLALARLTGVKNVGEVLKHGEDTKDFKRLGGKTSGTIWGLLGQELPKPGDALAHGAELGRKTSKKRAAPAGRKRRVKRTSKIPVPPAAQRPAVARSAGRFMPALAADGSLLLLNAETGSSKLNAAEARVLVEWLVKLNAAGVSV